MIIDQSELCAE